MFKPTIESTLLALTLTLVGGCDDLPTSNDTSGTDSGTGSGDTSGTTSDPSPGADSSSGEAPDPCDSCSSDASCQDGACVCNEGFEGDGTTCDDVDECADGGDDCDENAECTNTPGGFDCECSRGFVGDGTRCEPAESCDDEPCDDNAECDDSEGVECTCSDGYEGDGFDCSDVDECSANPCDPNATCTNSEGSFECSCNQDFEGDGFVCNGTLGYFEPCEVPEVCASGLCVRDVYNHCSEFCDQAIADDCPNVGAAGFCIPVGGGDFACVGDLDTGLDGDAEILNVGDSATRSIGTLGDADLFHLDLPAGTFLIQVDPDPDDDIQLEFHNALGEPIGIANNGADGFIEAANLMTGANVSFVVVRNIGNSTGSYMISVQVSPA